MRNLSLKDVLSKMLLVFVALMIGTLWYFLVSLFLEEPKFDPWGEFSVQQVDSRRNSTEVPGVEHVFSISETQQINTSGYKCLKNDQNEPVQTGGAVSWYSVEPPGFQYNSGVFEGNGTLNPGCTNFDFVNTIPDQVIKEVNLKLETEPYVIMNIQGYNVPYQNGEEHGVRKPWTTENFAFVK